jgi:hypothetical protein
VPPPDWRDVVADRCTYYCLKHDRPADREHLRSLVDEYYKASARCPRWGKPRVCAVRLMVAGYWESGFNPETVNFNQNGTIDLGTMQINSVHWFKTEGQKTDFELFCREMGVKPKVALLLDERFNIEYAAWLQERCLRFHLAPYHYDDYPEKKLLYDLLMDVLKQYPAPAGKN